MGRILLCNWVLKVIHSFAVINPRNMWKVIFSPCANFWYVYDNTQLIVHCHQNRAHWDNELFLLINTLTNNTFWFCSFTWTTEEVKSCSLGWLLFYQVLYVKENSPLISFGMGFCNLLPSPLTISYIFPKHSLNLFFITCMWCSKRLKHPTLRNQTGSVQISTVVPDSQAAWNYSGHFSTHCHSSINRMLSVVVMQIHIEFI